MDLKSLEIMANHKKYVGNLIDVEEKNWWNSLINNGRWHLANEIESIVSNAFHCCFAIGNMLICVSVWNYQSNRRRRRQCRIEQMSTLFPILSVTWAENLVLILMSRGFFSSIFELFTFCLAFCFFFVSNLFFGDHEKKPHLLAPPLSLSSH